MNFKVIALTLALGFSGSIFAANQTVVFDGDGVAQFSSKGFTPILDGGDDVITFTGLAAGSYDFVFSFSSQHIDFLTGQSKTPIGSGKYFVSSNSNVAVNGIGTETFNNSASLTGSWLSIGSSPFTLYLKGTPSGQASYSGEISVTHLPEPESYAMMLVGLGALGFLARRRRS